MGQEKGKWWSLCPAYEKALNQTFLQRSVASVVSIEATLRPQWLPESRMSADCSCCHDTRFAICLKTCFSSVDCGHACSPLRQSSSHSDTEHCIIRSELRMLALPCPGNEKRLCFFIAGNKYSSKIRKSVFTAKGVHFHFTFLWEKSDL